MRDQFHEELEAITASLVDMTRLVGRAMGQATTALLDADLTLAESVIEADEHVDALYRATDAQVFNLMARQQPVAGDLRVCVTSLRMVADIERMGDLALHIAKVARLRYPASAVPQELRGMITEMGQAAERICAKMGHAIAEQDVQAALELEDDDDVIDALHRKVFAVLLDPDWPHGAEPVIDMTLCGRYYERFGDHAVSVARRVVYLVTGQRHEPPLPAVLVRDA